MQTAILFGAGASFGAGGSPHPEAPPLGDFAHASLKRAFPATWGNLNPEADRTFEAHGFETGMVELLEAGYSPEINRLLIDMAIYFSRFKFADKTSCYHTIAKTLHRSQIDGQCTVASLNYECLAELAFSQAGLTVAYRRSKFTRADSRNTPILKLHGSCNFLPHTGNNRFIGTEFIGPSNEIIFDGPIEPIPPAGVELHYATTGDVLPPAMSYYAPGKHTPSAPDAIKAVRQEWSQACASARAIFIVGSRPLQADTHVFSPILLSKAKVFMIGGRDSENFADFSSTLGPRLEYLADYFHDGLALMSKTLRRISKR